MKEFTVLSGESYSVMANTPEEAEAKFADYIEGLPCTDHYGDECECIQYSEALTVVL